MEIVVLDGYTLNPGDLSWQALEQFGNVTVYDRTTESDIVPRAKQASIILLNKTRLTKETILALPNLKYIGVLATGYDVVDLAAAQAQGITVTNIPVYGTEAVAQFAIGLLFEIAMHIGHHSESVKAGNWSRNPDWTYWDYPLMELSGKKMGIIGYGRIGQTTGRIAQALNMKVLAFDRSPNLKLENKLLSYTTLEELYTESDIVVLHTPLTNETREMINKKSLQLMKDGVIIINNSRGELINEGDLAQALHSGKVRAAGLDVVSTEPIKPDNPLLTAPNCLITPHISWAPKEARERLMKIAVMNVSKFINGQPENQVVFTVEEPT